MWHYSKLYGTSKKSNQNGSGQDATRPIFVLRKAYQHQKQKIVLQVEMQTALACNAKGWEITKQIQKEA